MSISKIAPDKMRGSFYTSALVSLELFTDSAIHSMTAYTDFDCYTTLSAIGRIRSKFCIKLNCTYSYNSYYLIPQCRVLPRNRSSGPGGSRRDRPALPAYQAVTIRQ